MAEPKETPVRYIPLAGPLADRDAELSGLTWCGDTLFILPQFPDFVARRALVNPAKGDAIKGESYLYTIEKQQLEDFLEGRSNKAITPKALPLNERQIRNAAANFDGFEALVCKGKKIWLSIETSDLQNRFMTHVATAKFTNDKLIEIDSKPLAIIPSLSGRHNASNEALLLTNNKLLSIHEVNVAANNSSSLATRITIRSAKAKPISFPAIAHRITDASMVDKQDKFWAINYGFSADPHLANTDDSLLSKYGVGATHKLESNVERLVQFKITKTGVELTDQPPIALKLTQENGRNWEGIARYKKNGKVKGLLIVTDKYPKTYFGFVALSD